MDHGSGEHHLPPSADQNLDNMASNPELIKRKSERQKSTMSYDKLHSSGKGQDYDANQG